MLSPWNKTGDRPYITVLLDDSSPTKRKPFHCVICGQVTFEYFSNVRIILAGLPDEAEMAELQHPTIHACTRKVSDHGTSRSCKTMYVIA